MICYYTVLCGTAIRARRSQLRFPIDLLRFLLTPSYLPHYGPGFDSASNKNEYQKYLLGGCVGLTTLLLSRVDCLENSGNIKLL
jgi:hypothetical protein